MAQHKACKRIIIYLWLSSTNIIFHPGRSNGRLSRWPHNGLRGIFNYWFHILDRVGWPQAIYRLVGFQGIISIGILGVGYLGRLGSSPVRLRRFRLLLRFLFLLGCTIVLLRIL